MEDVLDISDPSSDMFDGEADELRDQIAALQLNITQTEQEIERDKEALKKVYELQGAKPKKTSKDSSTPLDKREDDSSAPEDTRQVVLKSREKELAKKTEAGSKKKTKSKAKKGEIDLKKLRKDQKLNEIVKKQLAEFSKKGKMQSSIKHLPKSSKVTLNFDSSDSEDSVSDNEDSESCDNKKSKRVSRSKTNRSSKFNYSSSEASDSSSNSDSDNSSASNSSSSKRKKKNKRKVKSNMVAKASDDVVNPQTWPQTSLQYEYINKSISFQDLDFKLFVAGELETIGLKKITSTERKGRLSLLKKIVYYSSIYTWKALLDFYAAFVRQIELGKKTWKDDPVDIEVPLLSKHVKQDYGKKSNYPKKDLKAPSVWYCAAFQRNKCTKSSPHNTNIRGTDREVHHICAACYRIDKVKSGHPECSPACPHSSE